MEDQRLGPVERLVLGAIGDDGSPVDAIAERCGQPPETVAAVVSRLWRDGLVQTTPRGVRLTGEGRSALAGATPAPDFEEIARHVGTAITAHMRERAAAAEAARDAVLVSDADRDAAVAVLAEAFSRGRISSAELEQRSGRALAARTHGDLDDLLAGLGGYRLEPPRHPVRKTVFGAVAVVASPFVLLGTLALLSGKDLGDRGVGLVLLLLVVPALLGLRRWAWPRR